MEFYILGGLSFVASSSTCGISQVNFDVITSGARTFMWRQWKKLLFGVTKQPLIQMCNIVSCVHTVALPSVRTVTGISLTL